MLKRTLAPLLGCVLLTGCSGAPEQKEASEAQPDSYSFRRADLYRDTPRDICSYADREFARKLMTRIDQALPPSAKGSAQFEEFFVQKSPDGKGEQAVVRFTARHGDAVNVPMFALGHFEEPGCQIGSMKASVGRDIFLDEGKQGFDIP